MIATRRTLPGTVLVLFAFLLPVQSPWATTPADPDRETKPTTFRLTFSDPIDNSSIGAVEGAFTDVTTGPPEPGSSGTNIQWGSPYGSLAGYYAELFAVNEVISRGQTDPWAEYRFTTTNLLTIPVQVRIETRVAINEIVGVADVEGFLQATVEDTSGNGDASYLSDYFAFEGWNVATVFEAYPGTPVFDDVLVGPGGPVVLYDATGSVDPTIFGGTSFNEMWFGIQGIISPGDTVILDVLTCLNVPGGACPAQHSALTVVPLPPSLVFLIAGFAALARAARRRV